MTRALTSPEIDLLRLDGTSSKIYLAIHKPTVVFACRVNQTFTTFDKIVSVIFDGVTTGAFGDVIPGMTVYIGSSLGAYDLGMVRARKAFTSTIAYLGENSEIVWADNLFLTVVDEFGFWAKHPKVDSSGVALMDQDVAYSNQHTAFAPVPVIGSHAVLWLVGGTCSIQFDATDSWCLVAGAKTYLWASPGSFSISSTTAINPTITFHSAGVFRVSCQVTVGGISHTGYRYVFVYEKGVTDPISEFTLRNCSGERDRGGWEFTVQMYGSQASISNVRDRAMVILFSEDYYGSTAGSIAAHSGRQNIIAMGWIAKEAAPVEDGAHVEFQVRGPNFWMEKITGFIDGMEDTPGVPTAWTNMKNLTIDQMIWHLCTWRSTVISVMDVYQTGELRQAPSLQSEQTNLWAQIQEHTSAMLAMPCCDRYGRMFLEIEQQLVPTASRSTFPTVMTLTKEDWANRLDVDRDQLRRTARVDLSGIKFNSTDGPSAIFSLAGGHVFTQHGEVLSVPNLLLEDQAKSNVLAGLIMGFRNYQYEFAIDDPNNNRMVDIAPRQYIGLSIAPGDTDREYTFSGKMVVRHISLGFDSESGFIAHQWSGENETFPENSVDGDIPASSVSDDIDFSTPPFPPFPALPSLPYTYPPANEQSDEFPRKIVIATTLGVLYTENADAPVLADIVWQFMNSGLDTTDRSTIAQLVVTPSGALYIMTNGSPSTGYGKVMRAPGLGGSWTTVKTSGSRTYNGGSHPFRIVGLGVNKSSNDQVGIADTVDYIAFGASDVGRFYVGNTSFSAGTNFFSRNINSTMGVTFQENKWFVFGLIPAGIGGSLPHPELFRFSAAGALETSANFTTGVGQTGGHYRASSSNGKIYLWVEAGNNNGYYVAVPALTYTFYDEITYVFDPEGVQGLAVSPTGLVAMGADDNGPFTPYLSTDSLATFTSVAGTIPIGSDVWESCRDDFRFLFGGGSTGPRFTPDRGTTYFDLSGNLSLIAAARDMTHCRFIE